MVALTTRAAKGSPLTHDEVDANFTGLNTGKAETVHGHVIGDVTGLQAALDGKQEAGSYQPLASVLTNTTASFTTAQETKLAGIASGATANSSDATLLARENHTGLQAAATISDFASTARSEVEAELVQGVNITITPSGSGASRQLTIAATGGSSVNSGTATLNFGNAPGTNVVSVSVTGETDILSTSHVEAWLMGDSTASHNAYEHLIVPLSVRCGAIIEGTGFDIIASSDLRLTGTFTVHWTWV